MVTDTLALLVRAYPDTKVPKDTLTVYADKLCDLPAYVLARAAHVCICTQKWFPKISELREAAADIIMQGRGYPTADDAWLELKAVIRGARDGFSHPLVERAVGGKEGVRAFGRSSTEPRDEEIRQRQFIAAYNALLADERRKVIVGEER